MNAKNKPRYWLGALIASGVATGLAALIRIPQTSGEWPGRVRSMANDMIGNSNELYLKYKNINKNLVIGSIAGSVVGATVALLLAPKAGKDLIHDAIKSLRRVPLPGHLNFAQPAKKTRKAVNKGVKKVVRHVAAAKRVVKSVGKHDVQKKVVAASKARGSVKSNFHAKSKVGAH